MKTRRACTSGQAHSPEHVSGPVPIRAEKHAAPGVRQVQQAMQEGMHAVLTGMQPAYDAMAMRVRGMQTFHAALHHASASTEAVHAQLPLLETFPILGSGVQGDVREIEVDGELMAIKTMTFHQGHWKQKVIHGAIEAGFALASSQLGRRYQDLAPHVVQYVGILVRPVPTTTAEQESEQALADPGLVGLAKVEVHMLMPLYSGGTLSSHMDNMPQDVYMLGHMPKNVAEILSFLRDIATGLYQVNCLGFVHGDLHSANVMLKTEASVRWLRAQLIDVGGAALLRPGGKAVFDQPVCAIHACSIEQLLRYQLGITETVMSSDVWSVGRIILDMLLGPKAFEQMALDPYGFWAPPMMQKIMLEGDVETLWRVLLAGGTTGSQMLVTLPARWSCFLTKDLEDRPVLDAAGQPFPSRAGQAAMELLRLAAQCLMPEGPHRPNSWQLVALVQNLCARFGVPDAGSPQPQGDDSLTLKLRLDAFPTSDEDAIGHWQLAMDTFLNTPQLLAAAQYRKYDSEWLSFCARDGDQPSIPSDYSQHSITAEQWQQLKDCWFMSKEAKAHFTQHRRQASSAAVPPPRHASLVKGLASSTPCPGRPSPAASQHASPSSYPGKHSVGLGSDNASNADHNSTGSNSSEQLTSSCGSVQGWLQRSHSSNEVAEGIKAQLSPSSTPLPGQADSPLCAVLSSQRLPLQADPPRRPESTSLPPLTSAPGTASTPISTPPSTSAPDTASTPISTPTSTSAPDTASTPISPPTSTSAPDTASTPISPPTSTSTSAPDTASTSTPSAEPVSSCVLHACPQAETSGVLVRDVLVLSWGLLSDIVPLVTRLVVWGGCQIALAVLDGVDSLLTAVMGQ
eukprot:CAMPEP_0119115862 /NCGR_PEP_ID=MMETSP1180-20130426/51975_1 /TAXON_ID=3052 ORGANISM="Chlamydomonas cf sp, Strain CCMP681" /NCGR_SAMPLE_ID=MMETSP1180 /ASSEMBLY_ACC=CAM_ASM_000741 /LENGTH=853 /DNA_ID=CAMNT_0007104965 /DNA_START=83 /DNA_END=2644 /DNA_ORIENTATION=-